ncbi:MAG: HNH endonuclease [Vicinamibacterales bacterium]
MATNNRDGIRRIPSAKYIRALRRVRKQGVSPSEWRLLLAHFEAPRQTLSWRTLARLVGYPSPEPVKLLYGRLAHRLATELGLRTPPEGFWLHVVADWGPKADPAGHTTFRLRSQMVTALRSMAAASRRPAQQPRVHLVQGGVSNGDKDWLDANVGGNTRGNYTQWVVPKHAVPGDHVIIFVQGLGFYSTGRIASVPAPRRDWVRRYGAHIENLRHIQPPISLESIRRHLPTLRWANYPRSIHTLTAGHADQVLALVERRRRTRLPEASADIELLSLEELRALALAAAKPRLPVQLRRSSYRQRADIIRRYVLARAHGVCDACGTDAPFRREDGSPYLEPHHLRRVADDGPDHPTRVAAVCPNCHRRVHHGADGKAFNSKLARRVAAIETGATGPAARRRNGTA